MSESFISVQPCPRQLPIYQENPRRPKHGRQTTKRGTIGSSDATDRRWMPRRDGGAGRTNEEECRPRGSIPKNVQAPPPLARSSILAPRTRAARSPLSVLRSEARGLTRGHHRSLRPRPAREDATRLSTGKEGSLVLVRDVPYPLPLARSTFLSSSFRDTSGDIREVHYDFFARAWKNLMRYLFFSFTFARCIII